MTDFFDNPVFDLQFDFRSIPGMDPEIFYPPDPVIGAQGLRVSLGILVRDGFGSPVGTSMVDIVLSTGRYQEVVFTDVVITPGTSAPGAPGSTVDGFGLSFRLDGFNIETSEPLFDVHFVADWSTMVPTAVPGAPDAEPGPGLVAVPAVMRSRTELRIAEARPQSGTVAVLDLRGRVVRRLVLPAGARSVSWDGRDAAGESAASGVYWARIEGSPAAAARIVRLR